MEIFETSLSRSIKFWILFILEIPSVFCSVFILYHMLFFSTYRRILSNHVIIIMLIISLLSVLIDLSLTLNYLRQGLVNPQSISFCLFWMYIDYSLYTSGILLTAYASIERHILVFTYQYFRLFYRKIFAHYFPILFCLFYPFLFYIYPIFFYPCKLNLINFNKTFCGSPCFKHQSSILNWYDMLIHNVLPSILIVTFSLALLIRIIKQKRRIQQELFSWRRQRRLVVQLLSITCLYIIMNMPVFIIVLIQKCCLETFAVMEYSLYFFYLYYFLILLLPFVCLGSLGDLKKKLRRFKYCLKRNSAQVHVRNDQRTIMPPVKMN